MRTADWSFLSFFKSNKKRKLYYLGKEDFYQSRNVLNVSSAFNFHKELYLHNFKTGTEIRFYGIAFGKNLKDIKKLFGRPNYVQKKGLPLESQSTLFYKLTIKGIKCILQMHLFDDQLFFAQIQLRDANKSLRNTFLDLFKLKYKLPELDWNQTIEDELGSRIALKDDVVPKASFFSCDKNLWKEIDQELCHNTSKDNYSSYNTPKIALRWS